MTRNEINAKALRVDVDLLDKALDLLPYYDFTDEVAVFAHPPVVGRLSCASTIARERRQIVNRKALYLDRRSYPLAYRANPAIFMEDNINKIEAAKEPPITIFETKCKNCSADLVADLHELRQQRGYAEIQCPDCGRYYWYRIDLKTMSERDKRIYQNKHIFKSQDNRSWEATIPSERPTREQLNRKALSPDHKTLYAALRATGFLANRSRDFFQYYELYRHHKSFRIQK